MLYFYGIDARYACHIHVLTWSDVNNLIKGAREEGRCVYAAADDDDAADARCGRPPCVLFKTTR